MAGDQHPLLVDQNWVRPPPFEHRGGEFLEVGLRCEAAGCWHTGPTARSASARSARPTTAGLGSRLRALMLLTTLFPSGRARPSAIDFSNIRSQPTRLVRRFLHSPLI